MVTKTKRTTVVKTTNRRRRRTRRTKQQPLVRTTNQIQSNLMMAPRPPPMSAKSLPYLMCRLYPFEAKPSNGIPDGDNIKKIVIDHRAYSTITVGTSGNFVLKFVPWLPHTALFKSSASAGFLINGVAASGLAITSTAGWWQPAVTYPEYATYLTASGSRSTEISNPYLCTKFRIVTMAAKITYVGAPTSATGTVTVYDDPIQYIDDRLINDITVEYGATSTSANTVMISRVDQATVQASLSSQTYVSRTDIPVLIRNKHMGDKYDWRVTTPTKVYPVDTTQMAGPAYVSNLTGPIDYCGLLGFDPQWVPATALFEGATVGTTFRVETIICVEYQPGVASDAYRLAKESPKDNTQTTIVQTQVKQTPTAVDANKTGRPVNDGRRDHPERTYATPAGSASAGS